MPAPPMSAKLREDILAAYESCGTVSGAARACGVATGTVAKVVGPTSTTKTDAELLPEVHRIAQAGGSIREICHELKISDRRASKLLKTVPPPPPAEVRSPLPESWALDYKPFQIDGPAKVLFLSDVHIPFHDRAAIEAAVAAGVKHGCNLVYLNGDALDFHGVSRYDHDGCAVTYQQEIGYGKEFFAYLRGKFKKARIVYKEGNHEERLERYVLARAPALFGLEGVNLASLLGLAGCGVEHVGEQRVVRLGKLSAIHGHEYGGGTNAPVNGARWLLLRTRKHAIMGHLHHTSEQTEQAIDGSMLSAWSVGCLCGLNPRYRRLSSRWSHGFAMVDVSAAGEFEVRNARIFGGKVL